MVRIAHGLFTWRDGREALEACLRSTAPHVDELIIADGLIDGVPANGEPWHSDWQWLDGATWLPRVTLSSKPWRSLSAACTWILATARARGCDWLLYVDADQELHNGQALSLWLGHPAYPSPARQVALSLARTDDGLRHAVPWQCVHVPALSRYLAGCFVVELAALPGQAFSLVPSGLCEDLLPASAPWISHHPERRPPGRRSHRLGQLETVLEPPPLSALTLQASAYLLEPAVVTAAPGAEPAYFCDQCGERYYGPGSCQNQHPPATLRRVDEVEAPAAPPDTPIAPTAGLIAPTAAPEPVALSPSPPANEPSAAGPGPPWQPFPGTTEAGETPTPAEPAPTAPPDEFRAALERAHEKLSGLDEQFAYGASADASLPAHGWLIERLHRELRELLHELAAALRG